jgi:hypothetical protein
VALVQLTLSPANFSWQQIAQCDSALCTPAVIHTSSPFLSDLISHQSLVRSLILSKTVIEQIKKSSQLWGESTSIVA